MSPSQVPAEAPSARVALGARNVSHAYTAGQPVLHDISFEVHAAQVIYLLGRNGSGKTTLLSCLSGLLKPSVGEVLLEGQPLRDYPAAMRARRVGLIPQIHLPAFAYSVRDMVLMGRAPHLPLFGVPGREDAAITDQALEQVGLQALAQRPYTELSGGERQLVMIARGLAQQCRVLLMDEPDAHLDPNNQHRVMSLVNELARAGLSFVVSSHSPNNALLYADRVLLLQQGHLLAEGTAQETLTAPLLSAAYGIALEVIHATSASPDDAVAGQGATRPRAILPVPPGRSRSR